MVAINTSVGRVTAAYGSRRSVFEASGEPEDTATATALHRDGQASLPDLSDSKYMHSVWNAMDLLETKLRCAFRTGGMDRNRTLGFLRDVVLRDARHQKSGR
jgi:hypothetical protein